MDSSWTPNSSSQPMAQRRADPVPARQGVLTREDDERLESSGASSRGNRLGTARGTAVGAPQEANARTHAASGAHRGTPTRGLDAVLTVRPWLTCAAPVTVRNSFRSMNTPARECDAFGFLCFPKRCSRCMVSERRTPGSFLGSPGVWCVNRENVCWQQSNRAFASNASELP